MTAYKTVAEKRTDPRPAYIYAGRDETGAEHVYHTRSERVYIIIGGGVAYRKVLTDEHDINEYLETVAAELGWADQRLHVTAGDALRAQVQS